LTLTSELKSFALKHGADRIGIASVESLKDSPEGRSVADVLPNARSVIVIALRMLDSVVNTLPSPIYMNTGYITVNAELNRIAYQVSKFLEEKGYFAVPVPATRDYDMKDVKGTFSVVHVGEAAGLGRIGVSGLLLTPNHGPRVRFVSVFTTADLEPDQPIESEICTKCMVCVQACPMGAIHEEGSFDAKKCLSSITVYTGESVESVIERIESLGEIPHHIFVARNLIGRNVLPPICGMCVKVCPIGKVSLK
jgi:epoxyqueuosine reductase QueG